MFKYIVSRGHLLPLKHYTTTLNGKPYIGKFFNTYINMYDLLNWKAKHQNLRFTSKVKE